MKIHSLRFCLFLFIVFSGWLTSCGVDLDDERDSLYDELVGTYNLFKAELTYPNQPLLVLTPPQISGTMTISSNQRLTQTISMFGTVVSASGTFEIREDENLLIIDNDTSDLISKSIYTWNGSVLTTTLDVGAFVERDFWRKL